MDTERVIVLSVAIAGLTFVGGLVFNMVLGALARARGNQPSLSESQIDARLGRIEVAVETMAIELERLSELQRFNARIEAQRLPEPRPIARPSTPH